MMNAILKALGITSDRKAEATEIIPVVNNGVLTFQKV